MAAKYTRVQLEAIYHSWRRGLVNLLDFEDMSLADMDHIISLLIADLPTAERVVEAALEWGWSLEEIDQTLEKRTKTETPR